MPSPAWLDGGTALGRVLATPRRQNPWFIIVVGGELATAGDVLQDSINRSRQRSTATSRNRPINITIRAQRDMNRLCGGIAGRARAVHQFRRVQSRNANGFDRRR